LGDPRNPFQFVAFVIFVVSGLIALGVPPMDGAHSSLDIHGGVGSHLHGRRLTLFRLSRFYGFFLWSVIASVLFLGAWNLPAPLESALRESESWGSLQFLEAACLLAKTFVLMMTIVWISRVNPRARVDQVTDFAWKVLSPFALFALIGVGLWAGWRAL
jgi:NADH-quinone oxidoreductase subunit H